HDQHTPAPPHPCTRATPHANRRRAPAVATPAQRPARRRKVSAPTSHWALHHGLLLLETRAHCRSRRRTTRDGDGPIWCPYRVTRRRWLSRYAVLEPRSAGRRGSGRDCDCGGVGGAANVAVGKRWEKVR